MAKQADATDLKSVVRKDVRVRSPLRVPLFGNGVVIANNVQRALVRADFKRAGKLVNESSRRPALFSSSSHDHPADWKPRG